MLDYKEPSLAWDQGGTIREAGPVWFGPAFDPQLPPWLVMTRDVWDHAPAAWRDGQFAVAAHEAGWAYADRGRSRVIEERSVDAGLPDDRGQSARP